MSELRLPENDDRAEKIVARARELYGDVVVDHWLQPRHLGLMKDADGRATLTGSCEDMVEIALRLRDDCVEEARFVTDGCVTTIASASVAVELATGSRLADAMGIDQQTVLDALGGLPEDSEHCAALAADALREALVEAARTRREPWKRLYRAGR